MVSHYTWVCSNFFDGYVMSVGRDGVYDEGNEFVKVVILGKGVPYVI